MTYTSRAILAVGAILLVHACYSAQEFSSLTPAEKRDGPLASGSSSLSSLTGSAGSQLSSLPLDIVIETIISVALLCVAIVLGSEELKPISWRVWASNVERQKSKRNAIENLGKVQIEGYDWLEDGNRKSFLDVRGKRKDFAEWVKAGGSNSKD